MESAGKMKFEDILSECLEKQKPVFINGYGVGKVSSIGEDYIDFEVVKEKEDSNRKKVDGKMKDIKDKYLTKEVITFPISKIDLISTGAKRLEKTEKEQTLDNDLGGL